MTKVNQCYQGLLVTNTPVLKIDLAIGLKNVILDFLSLLNRILLSVLKFFFYFKMNLKFCLHFLFHVVSMA